ncbi:hypothetical protein [Bacillus velezensis]|uniref:hypothetical protein n=1 Tax=Bacillus velezensis TaxID=492670 RepID=UPI001E2FC3D9|nr:hypothetical protein [Bacillus velezensis]
MTTYESKPVANWNTRDFQAYLAEQRLYDVPYAPFRGYQAEAGMLGRWVGTKQKPGAYGPEITKRFIDLCFAEYKPSLEYPGLSFGLCRRTWDEIYSGR